MKRIGILLTLFCVGLLAASFAFADNGGKGKDKSRDRIDVDHVVRQEVPERLAQGHGCRDDLHGHGRQVEQGRPRSQGQAGDPDVLRQGQCQRPDVLGRHQRRHARPPRPSSSETSRSPSRARAATSPEPGSQELYQKGLRGPSGVLGPGALHCPQHSADSAGLPLRRQAHVRYPGGLRRCSACPRPSARRSSSRTTFLEEASSLDDPGRCA